MTQEQLIQEAKKEAEKVYPVKVDSEEDYYTNIYKNNELRREGYVQCYIQQAEKRKSEAVLFARFVMSKGNNSYFNTGKPMEQVYQDFKRLLKQE